MASIPAVCDDCRRLFFFDRLIGGTGTATVEMVNVGVGPCPHCGGMGTVPNGVYQVAQNVVRYLGGAGLSVNDLALLRSVLSDEVAKSAPSTERLSRRIDEDVPAASGLVQLLISTKGVALATWLLFLLSLIGILTQHLDATGRQPELSPAQVEQIIHAVMAPTPSVSIPPAPQGSSNPSPRVGRNARCPCGSGRKFKHCCLSGRSVR